MRSAVVRINVDPSGTLTRADYLRGLKELEALDLEVVATPAEQMPERNCEVELIVTSAGLNEHVQRLVSVCARAFQTDAEAGVVTFISRGTDDDVRGVLQGFRVRGEVERVNEADGEVVLITVPDDDLRHVSEGRLHTALVAALNCEVRIVRASAAR